MTNKRDKLHIFQLKKFNKWVFFLEHKLCQQVKNSKNMKDQKDSYGFLKNNSAKGACLYPVFKITIF